MTKVKNYSTKALILIKSIIQKVHWWTWAALGIILIFSPIVYFTLIDPSGASAEWFDDSWSRRKKITIDKTKVSGSTNFTDFPVLIDETDTNLKDHAQSDGDDILFVDTEGKKLDHEIERYDSTTGDLEAWVKVPTLLATEDTVLFMYYGNPSISNQQNAEAVWNGSDKNYDGVWHLGESSSTRFDATANNNDLTDNNTVTSNPGTIGIASQFTNANSEYLSIADNVSLSTGDIDWSLSYWAYLDNKSTSQAFVSRQSPAQREYTTYYRTITDFFWLEFKNTDVLEANNIGSPSTATWYYLVWWHNAGSNELGVQINGGTPDTMTSTTTGGDTTAPFEIGRAEGANNYLDGRVDEVRFQKSAWSSDYRATTYNTQNHSTSAFYTLASQETTPGPIGFWKFDEGFGITANDSTQSNNTGILGAVNSGDGTDGALSLTASLNMNTTDSAADSDDNGTYADGIAYNADPATATTSGAVIKLYDTPSGLGAGDEIVLINLQGASGDVADVGNYEFLEISSITSKELTFTTNIQNSYDGTTPSNQKVLVQRIPQYTSVTLTSSGSMTASAWDGTATTPTGDAGYHTGIVAFRVTGTVSVGSGTSITTSGLGYAGGASVGQNTWGRQGEGTTGAAGSQTCSANGNGGGGGEGTQDSAGGGGGGHSAAGTNGVLWGAHCGGTGGSSVGVAALSTLFLGGGGGSGGGDEDGSASGAGGIGGGIIFVAADTITVTGNIRTNGNGGGNGSGGGAGMGGGGGGSGGSIFLAGNNVTLGSSLVTASGGAKGLRNGGTGGNGGAGSTGRIHVEYVTISGTSSPAADTSQPTNSPTWQTSDLCVSGNCLLFNGSDDAVTVINSNSLDLNLGTATGVTFQGWIRVNSDGESNVGEIYNKGSTSYLRITNEGTDGLADLEASLDLATDATATVTNGITLNKWHLVTVTYTDDADDEITVYIDGKNRATSTNGVGSPAADTNNLLIGGSSAANFHGFIDEFKIYPFERTTAEITTDFNRASGLHGASVVLGAATDFLSDGLVGYWKMDETSGNATDSSGNTTTLTNTNTVTYTASKFSTGAEFNGTTQYFDAVDNSYLSVTGSLSLTAWIEPDDVTGSQDIIGKWDGANESYLLALEGGELRMYIDSASNYETTTSTPITANTLQHVTGVYDATTQTVNLYVNGVIQSSSTTGTIPSSIGDDAGEFNIGAEDSSGTAANFFDGHIDEARVYNRTLSPGEVSQLNNFAPKPVGYWKFDKNTGTAAYDSSGYGNSGTFETSMTQNDWIPGKFGGALDFDGVDDYVSVPDSDSLGVSDNISLSAWINSRSFARSETASGYYHVIARNNTNGTQGFELGVHTNVGDTNSGAYSCIDNNCILTETENNINSRLNEWLHIAYTWDGSNHRIYVDGILVKTQAYSGSLTDVNERLGIGISPARHDQPTDLHFNGFIDEVKVYNYARTAGQIVEDMNAGHPIGGSPIGSQTVYWKFDEQQGTTADDTIGNENGTIDANAAWKTKTDCKLNGCLEFDAAAEEVLITNANDADIDFNGSEAFSGSAWVRVATMPGSGEQDAIIAKWDETSALRGYRLVVENDDADTTGNFQVEIYDESANQAITASGANDTVSINTWYHVLFTFNGGVAGTAGDLKLYVDGAKADENAVNTSFLGLEDVANDFTVAEYDATDVVATNTAFTGRVDELKIYNSALTAAQVLIDKNFGSVVAYSTGQDKAADIVGGAGNPPIGYWNLDENTGTAADVIKDTSENSNTLDPTGSMTESDWVPGKIGSALSFDGSDDYLNGTDTGYPTGSTARTLSAWIKIRPGSSGDRIIASYGNNAINNQHTHLAIPSSGVLRLGFWNNDANGISTVSTGVWHHVVGTYDGSTTVKLYIDGILDNTVTVSATATALTGKFYIGAHAAGTPISFFDGEIDEVKLYDYARNPAQVAYDFNRGAPISRWKLDECQGTTLNDASVDGNGDSNGNTGTWTGATGGNTSVGTCGSGAGTEAWNNGTTGKRNASLDFDGTDDVVTITNADEIDFDKALNDEVTFSTWIYANSDGENNVGEIFDKGTTTYCRTDTESAGKLDLECSLDLATTDATLNLSGALNTNTWHHIVMTYADDGDDEITIYVDGVNKGSSTNGVGSPAATDTNNLLIGGSSAANFDGQIDDFKVFTYELSLAQVKKVRNESATRFGPETGSP